MSEPDVTNALRSATQTTAKADTVPDAPDARAAVSGPCDQDAVSGPCDQDAAAFADMVAPFGTPWSAAEGSWDGDGPPEPPGPPYSANAAAPPGDDSSGNALAPDLLPFVTEQTKAPEPKPMSLMEHLHELRARLIRCCIAVAIAFMACYGVADTLFDALCRPLIKALPAGSKLIFTALPEAFFVYLQVAFVAAVFLASPMLFYQIWAFIAPGLYEEEKKHIVPLAVFSAAFFIAGASLCYFVVFPFAFTFFIGFATETITAMPSLGEYLGFALKLLIAFGLIFEMPLFAFFLARMGIVTAAMMRRARRYAVLVIFIVAAILTPPDVVSQLLMAGPMLLLYECSILVAATFGRKPKEQADDTAAKASA